MAQGVMQSLIKISANFASEQVYRDMYRGMAAAQKVGKEMGKSYEKGFNNEITKPIGGVGNITRTQHQLLQKSVQKRLGDNLQEIDSIIDKSLLPIGSLATYMIRSIVDLDKMYRKTATYMEGDTPLKAFNDILRDPLENAAYEYATSIKELNNYVLEAIKSGFDPKNIASSLDSVAGLKRAYALSVPAITELIVMASNNNWVDPSDGESINKYLAKLVTMVRNTKGSLGDFSNTLGYAQPILNAPGMTDTDYITLMGVVSDSNIKGTRAGRAMGHFFQRLFVPDSNSDAIDKVIVSSLQKDGYNVSSKDMKSLSDYFASIGWSIYDEKGAIQIGEGKRYANYTDAITNLMEKIEKSDFTDAMTKGMGGEFGQIAQRVFEYLLANYPDLNSLRSQVVNSEKDSEQIIKTVLDMSGTGLGFTWNKFNSSLERVSEKSLELEESFGLIESSLKGLIWIFEKIGNGMGAVGEFKGNLDNKIFVQKLSLAYENIAEENNIDLKKASEKEKQNLLYSAILMVNEEKEKRKTNPMYSNPILEVGTGQGMFQNNNYTKAISETMESPHFNKAMENVESWEENKDMIMEYLENEAQKKQATIDRSKELQNMYPVSNPYSSTLSSYHGGISGALALNNERIENKSMYYALPNTKATPVIEVDISVSDQTEKGIIIDNKNPNGTPQQVTVWDETNRRW